VCVTHDPTLTCTNNVQRSLINNVTYLAPKVPTLYTALTVGRHNAQNPKIYGVNINPFVINYNDVIEVVINNQANSGHPWHLHGHKFQVVARSGPNSTTAYTGLNLPSTPMKRDVAGVLPLGHLVIRFRADNPGINLLHCHIEWHVQAGLTATFIEAVDRLELTAPLDHIDACVRLGTPTAGNAAGNLFNLGDLRGANVNVPLSDDGAMWRPVGNERMVRRTRGKV
jgi:iron transport multicopper oxidase